MQACNVPAKSGKIVVVFVVAIVAAAAVFNVVSMLGSECSLLDC
jgi:hypothetical protein